MQLLLRRVFNNSFINVLWCIAIFRAVSYAEKVTVEVACIP